jgi:uncharacterized protein (DUF305 family)
MKLRSLIVSPLVLGAALVLSACAAPSAAPAGTSPTTSSVDHSGMAGMDHGAMTSDAPYDAAFIDGMIVHHEGAVTMARQALEQAERPEIRELAEAIIRTQEAEIAQLRQWRTEWYPELPETAGMAMDMGPMEVPDGSEPFEQRFIQAMIPHHEAAVLMARDALQNAERQEIKDLAEEIIAAQEGEIAQMRQWLRDWYGIE